MHHCWLNGNILPKKDTFLHISDLGILRGYAMFDYFRTYNKIPFQWNWYWERFENSAKNLGINNPIAKDEAYEVVQNLINYSGLKEVAIRFVLTGGYSENSIKAASPNLLIMSEDILQISPQDYIDGMKLMTYKYVRDLPEIKSTDYKHLLIQQKNIQKNKVQDILLHDGHLVSELSRSNFFIFENDTLLTPKTNILKGITRRLVLEIAKQHFEVKETDISLEQVFNAQEAFTTSSTKRIMPIKQIDQKVFNLPGENTNKLREIIDDIAKNWGA